MKVKNKTVKKIVSCRNSKIEKGFVDFVIEHSTKTTVTSYKTNYSFVDNLKLDDVKKAARYNVKKSDFSIIISPLCNFCINTINSSKEFNKPYIIIDPNIYSICETKTRILELKKQKIVINIVSSYYNNLTFDWFKKVKGYSKYPLNPYTRGSRLARNLFELDE